MKRAHKMITLQIGRTRKKEGTADKMEFIKRRGRKSRKGKVLFPVDLCFISLISVFPLGSRRLS